MASSQLDWSNRLIAQLWKLWMQTDPQLSAKAIAERMGISKNAIVGKAHRLGLPARPSPIRQKGDSKPKLERLPGARRGAVSAEPTAIEVIRALVREQPKPVARSTQCCWPIGEVGKPDFHFCGARSEPGRPYCGEHCAVAYVRVRDRREDAA